MAAGEYDFTIEQGVTFLKTFIWKDSAGNAIDISNFIVRMQARNNYSDPDVLIDLSTEASGITITDGPAGTFEITMTAAETKALNFYKAVYDIEMESDAGEVTRLLEGKITLSREVTYGSDSN